MRLRPEPKRPFGPQNCMRLQMRPQALALRPLCLNPPSLTEGSAILTCKTSPEAQRCVGLQKRPDALAPMRLSSPTGLSLPSHSGWKRALVYGSSTKRLPLRSRQPAGLKSPQC